MSGWAANWETSEGKGKLLKPALNDLRGALDERLVAVGRRTMPILCPEITTGSIVSPLWFSTFSDEIDELIWNFADHTDNAGEWTGISSVPNWTMANILAVIGDAERVDVPNDPQCCAKWIYQQYKILNQLRWMRTFMANSGSDAHIKKDPLITVLWKDRSVAWQNGTLADAEAAVKAMPFTDISASWTGYMQGQTRIESGTPQARYLEFKPVLEMPDRGTSFAYTVYTTLRFDSFPSQFYRVDGTVPATNDRTLLTTTLSKLKEETTASASFASQSVINNDLSPMTKHGFSDGLGDTNLVNLLWYGLPSIILKFDFTYKNW